MPVGSGSVYAILLLFLYFLVTSSIDLTVEIKAGYNECFNEHVRAGIQVEVEYQVIDGGDLDIDFWFFSPHGENIAFDARKSDGNHKIASTEEGTYQFCLDNSFSHVSTKVVYFSIATDEVDPSWKINPEQPGYGVPKADIIGITIDEFRNSLDLIKDRLERSQQAQNHLRNYEARDRSIAEDNFTRVNNLSLTLLAVMMAVGGIQVFLIRSLFEDKSAIGRLLRKGN